MGWAADVKAREERAAATAAEAAARERRLNIACEAFNELQARREHLKNAPATSCFSTTTTTSCFSTTPSPSSRRGEWPMMRVMMMHLDQVGCDVHGMCDDERDYEGGGLENVSKKTRFQFINPGVCVSQQH